MADGDFLYQFRLILIGEMGVGKSSILRQFKEGEFFPDITQTVGVDFHARLVEVQGHPIKLQLWDTAGQDRFRAIVNAYYRNAVGGLLVYDIAKPETFNQLDDWLNDAMKYANCHKPVFVLVGNKSDQVKERKVSREEGMRYAQDHDMEYIETSAKTGSNVEDAFYLLAGRIYQMIEDGHIKLEEGWDGVKKGELAFSEKRRLSAYRDNGAASLQNNPRQNQPKKGCC